jgi:type III restriction enzyme
MDFQTTLDDKKAIGGLVFTGFKRCLYDRQKFDSDTERRFAILCDRDSEKWLKPAKGQIKIYYRFGNDNPEYVPDFIIETKSLIWMAETKAVKDLIDKEVLAKKDAATAWCKHASDYATQNGLKEWRYALIPHDTVKESMELETLLKQYQQ